MTQRRWLVTGAAVLVALVLGGGLLASRATQAPQAASEPPLNTANVELGTLSAIVSLQGTLTYRARPDGSPYSVTNQATGRFTALPDAGDHVDCGEVLYRVDNKPVLLLCGGQPAYRDLHYGYVGADVAQLNANLHTLGYDAAAGVEINPADTSFTWMTDRALKVLQHDTGGKQTGELYIEDAVFLPGPVRIFKLTGALGGPAQAGAEVLEATSATLEIQVDLDASQQGEVREGQPARITLPGNRSATGKVDRLGTVAEVPAGQTASAAAATIPAYISLDDSAAARGLDRAPVQVQITTDGVDSALSVPVTALLGKSGGGFAVEVVRDRGQRELVPVELGLFDTTNGRVQVDGNLNEGDQVVVPAL